MIPKNTVLSQPYKGRATNIPSKGVVTMKL